jgi:predicted metal-dependent hydrolase
MQLEYEIKFSKRKTLNITVERDRKIIVRAPLNLSIEKIEEIVQSKRQWLKEKINHTQKYPVDTKPKEFISGETLLYLGRNYQLLVVDEPIEGIEFNQRFRISRENQEAANKLFKAWYMKQALTKIEPLAKMYATNLGVKFTPNNNIIFNWRIIKAPMYVLEYLVAHELVHLIEENHTPRFWNILSIQVPNYQKAKNWLKLNGHLLEVDF